MSKLTLTDYLAVERTRLANERTSLAYFRTFIVILSSGLAILRLEALEAIRDLGIFFLIVAPVVLIVGLVRFIYVRKKLKNFYV
jgi:putative membrane protein